MSRNIIAVSILSSLFVILSSIEADSQSWTGSAWTSVQTQGNATNNTENIFRLGWVGIGVEAPIGRMHLSGDDTSIIVDRYTEDTRSANFHLRSARGTVEFPQPKSENDYLGTFNFHTFNQQRFLPAAQIYSIASEDHSTLGWGTDLRFSTTQNETGILKERLAILNNGNIGIGTLAPLELLEVNKTQDKLTTLKVVNTDNGYFSGSTILLQTNHPSRSVSIGSYPDSYAFSDFSSSFVISNHSINTGGIKMVTSGYDFDLRKNHDKSSGLPP